MRKSGGRMAMYWMPNPMKLLLLLLLLPSEVGGCVGVGVWKEILREL